MRFLGIALLTLLLPPVMSGTPARPVRPAAQASAPKYAATLTGVLGHDKDAPVLRVKDKSYRLDTSDDEIELTLADKRIAGKTLQMEGKWKDPQTFEVQRFFSVHNGKLFRVTYYCNICNITTYKPGLCMCCQNPTEPRELPYDPEGIH